MIQLLLQAVARAQKIFEIAREPLDQRILLALQFPHCILYREDATGLVVYLIIKGNKMQPLFAHRDESAWERGERAYDLDDTLDAGPVKAAQEGYRPGCNGYAAFLTAFARRVRMKQLHPAKAAELRNKEAASGSAVVLTGDFQRTAG